MAWFLVWDCGCSDVTVERDALPVVCPGHGSGPMGSPSEVDASGGYPFGHICDDDSGRPPCPALTIRRPVTDGHG